MTAAALDALRADHRSLVDLAEGLTPGEWETPSACDGWRVRDVVAHMVQLFRLVVDPDSLPAPDPSGVTERTNDRHVDAMRSLPVEDVLAAYRDLGAMTIDALVGVQANTSPIDLGDLGTHPTHLVTNAFAFDHHTHIRVDLFSPLGPLEHAAPPAEEAHLSAALDWMLAGMPFMCGTQFAWLDAPVTLELTGPGGCNVHIAPGGEQTIQVLDRPPARPTATITSSVEDLVLWGTNRRDWRELDVVLDGDTDLAGRVCDTIHVF